MQKTGIRHAHPRFLLLLQLVVSLVSASGGTEITQPQQPASGPGGADYPHQGFLCTQYGEGSLTYWLYEPAEPKPVTAPVIVFHHGWGAIDPAPYSHWLEHLAKKGNIVIYPAYQDKILSPAVDYTENAIRTIQSAKALLEDGSEHVLPNWDAFLIAGHSMGGLITINVACLWQQFEIPEPKAILVVQPADPVESRILVGKTQPSLIENIHQLSPSLKMVITLGSHDDVVTDSVALFAFEQSTQIPENQKNLLTLKSDHHGAEILVADHSSPITSGGFREEGEVDALDYYGYWKLLDALRDTVYLGIHESYAIGNTHEVRYMGHWSDGTPIQEIDVATLIQRTPIIIGSWRYYSQYPWIFNEGTSTWYYYRIFQKNEIWIQNRDNYRWEYIANVP